MKEINGMKESFSTFVVLSVFAAGTISAFFAKFYEPLFLFIDIPRIL